MTTRDSCASSAIERTPEKSANPSSRAIRVMETVRGWSPSLRATSAKSRNVGEIVRLSRPYRSATTTFRVCVATRGTSNANDSAAAATTGAADSTKNEPVKFGMPARASGV